MTKNSIVFTVLFILAFLCANCISLKAQDKLNLRLKSKPIGVVYQKDRKNKGSEFWYSDWNTGEIYLSNGQTIDNLNLNFNAYSNDLIYAIKGNTPVVVSKSQVKGFKVIVDNQDMNFVLVPDSVINNKKNESVYLELLYDGANRLYAHRKYKINETLVKDNPFNKSVFYTVIDYYVTIHNNPVNSPQSKSSYYNYYDKVMVKNIVRSNNLSLKEEADLVKFISLLDQATESNNEIVEP